MRRLLFIVVCCLFFCGCGKDENMEDLEGTWVKDETQYLEVNKTYLTFKNNGEFIYKIKVFNCETLCEEGFHYWQGKYSLNKNIIRLDITKEDTNFPTTNCELCISKSPSDKLIIDFDKMAICNRDDGIECDNKFKKQSE